MKLKSGLIVFLFVCLAVGSSAFAEEFQKARVGYWNVVANWKEGTIPSGSAEVKIRYPGTICTLNSVENWTSTTMTEMRVYTNGVLNIVAGGSLTGPGWLRVSDSSGPATLNQSGGTLTLKTGSSYSRLVIGDSAGSNGLYNMTGGTITYAEGDGFLIIGDRGGTGTFVVSGTAPVILMKTLYVGGRSGTTNVGTLQYVIGANGVSAIKVNTSVIFDAGGAGNIANLVVGLSGSAPPGNILLVNNTGSNTVTGKFNHFNGGDANEGATILMGGHPYALTYMYDANSRTVGSARSNIYNDIALIPTSITISTPAVETGDLLIAAVATDKDTSASIAAPAGQDWTAINCGANGSAVTLAAWWKLAGSSEPNSHTFAWTGSAVQAYGWMMCFSGHDTDHPINTFSTSNESSSTPTSPEVFTTVNNCLILRLGAFDDGAITVGNPGLTSPLHTAITMDKSSSVASSGVVSGGAGYVRQSGKGLSGNSNFSLLSAKAARMLTIAIAPNDTGKNACCEDDITP